MRLDFADALRLAALFSQTPAAQLQLSCLQHDLIPGIAYLCFVVLLLYFYPLGTQAGNLNMLAGLKPVSGKAQLQAATGSSCDKHSTNTACLCIIQFNHVLMSSAYV